MADERKIVIELKTTGISEDTSKTSDTGNGKTNDELKNVINTLMHPIRTAEKNTVGRNILANQAYQNAKQTVKNIGQYHIYKYFTLKENYLSETTAQNIQTSLNKATSFAASVGGGAMVGAAGGPVGAAIGAAIGAIGWTSNEIVGIFQTRTQERISVSTNNQQTSFQQTRLGLIDGRGGTNQ